MNTKVPLQLTESLEDYLEAILALTRVAGHAHVKEIAAKLKVKMPSVTSALRQLDDMQLIVYNSRYPVVLTSQGEKIAKNIIHRHTVLTDFFSRILGLEEKKASDTACRLEHVVDENTIARFVLFSEAIGNRTDAIQLQIYLNEAMQQLEKEPSARVISQLQPGQKAILLSKGKNLQLYEEKDPDAISQGTIVEFQALSLDQSKVRLLAGTKVLELPVSIAENIWVKPL